MQQAPDSPQVADSIASHAATADRMASEVVNRYSAWAAAAGVIPVPLLDVAAVAGVQLKMLRELASIYEVEFSDNIGKSLIAALVGAVVTSRLGHAGRGRGADCARPAHQYAPAALSPINRPYHA